MDIFGRKRIKELEAKLAESEKALADVKILPNNHTSFQAVSKRFKLDSLPSRVLHEIAKEMKPYVLPELHRGLSTLAQANGRNISRSCYVDVAKDVGFNVYHMEIRFPEVVIPMQVAGEML